MSAEAFRAEQEAAAAEIDEAELVTFAEQWGRLGYFPVDTDLRPKIATARDWVGGFYSTDDKTITVIGAVGGALIVHEHVHALQDQHFDLGKYHDVETSDLALTRSAVTEGDAELAENRFYLQEAGYDCSTRSGRSTSPAPGASGSSTRPRFRCCRHRTRSSTPTASSTAWRGSPARRSRLPCRR